MRRTLTGFLVHWQMKDLFFDNVHGILCLKIIAVVSEGAMVLTKCTTLKGSPDLAAGSTLF